MCSTIKICLSRHTFVKTTKDEGDMTFTSTTCIMANTVTYPMHSLVYLFTHSFSKFGDNFTKEAKLFLWTSI